MRDLRAAALTLLNEWFPCTCDEAYTGRNLIAPDCRHHDNEQIADEVAALSTPPEPGLTAWAELMTEVLAFEAWYLPSRLGVNAWVGVDTTSGFYGGWAVEGDPLASEEWDESEMMTASGDTPAEVIADLIRIAREYRTRRDAERAEWAADDEAASRLTEGETT